jgi:hypothetical protein
MNIPMLTHTTILHLLCLLMECPSLCITNIRNIVFGTCHLKIYVKFRFVHGENIRHSDVSRISFIFIIIGLDV